MPSRRSSCTSWCDPGVTELRPWSADDLSGPSWEVAPTLIGAVVQSRVSGREASVRLTEVEAYDQGDEASHSYRGLTPRTTSMFEGGGRLYVYLSYGIHWCANIVTGRPGHGAAVLLRAGEPLTGVEVMTQRRGRSDHLTDGPGKLAQALGIEGSLDGTSVLGGDVITLFRGERYHEVVATPRIGISRATERLWRFVGVTP